ncbi:MAG TPA: hypothetical protein V6C81_05575 [Planktothrix sp.]|jgi:tetratricopeptide (TPR) repeat protein
MLRPARCGIVLATALACVVGLASQRASAEQQEARVQYFDATQAEIGSKLGHQVSAYVNFDDAPGYVEGVGSCKEWSANERALITLRLQTIVDRAPGLIVAAGDGGKLRLLRTTRLLVDVGAFGMHPLESVQAATTPKGILITDKFFITPTRWQTKALAHEMTHASELGETVSHSHAWVAFAQQTITKIRKDHHPKSYAEWVGIDTELRSKNIWPSLYGCTNLREALADYVAATIFDSDFQSSEQFKSTILPLVIAQSDQSLQWNASFKAAKISFSESKDSKKYIGDLEALEKSDPSTASIYGFLSYFYKANKDFDKASNTIDEGKKLLNEAGVSHSDESYIYLLGAEASILLDQAKYEQSMQILNELLAISPDDKYGLQARSFVNYKLGNAQAATVDQKHLANLKTRQRASESEIVVETRNLTSLSSARTSVRDFLSGKTTVLYGFDSR